MGVPLVHHSGLVMTLGFTLADRLGARTVPCRVAGLHPHVGAAGGQSRSRSGKAATVAVQSPTIPAPACASRARRSWPRCPTSSAAATSPAATDTFTWSVHAQLEAFATHKPPPRGLCAIVRGAAGDARGQGDRLRGPGLHPHRHDHQARAAGGRGRGGRRGRQGRRSAGRRRAAAEAAAPAPKPQAAEARRPKPRRPRPPPATRPTARPRRPRRRRERQPQAERQAADAASKADKPTSRARSPSPARCAARAPTSPAG